MCRLQDRQALTKFPVSENAAAAVLEPPNRLAENPPIHNAKRYLTCPTGKPAPIAASHSPPIQSSRCQNTRGVTMSSLDNALQELREKRNQAQVEIDKLDQLISGIESLNGIGAALPSTTTRAKRIISAASRRKMALAQKARWASLRKKSQPIALVAQSTSSSPTKRTMSAAARRKIAAAQKARWAKIRAQEKKAA